MNVIKPSVVALALLFLLTAQFGCAGRRGGDTGDFMTAVNSIRPGTPMDAVRDELGAPDERHAGVMPVNPPPGPMDAVAGRIPAGARYRHWVYKRKDSKYHVFFANTTVQSGERWEVVSVRSLPASTVY